MNKIIDNSAEFLKRMEGRLKEGDIPHPSPPGRRVIHGGLNAKRQFRGVIRGEDILTGGGSLYDSSSISLGEELPPPEVMAKREQQEKILDEVQKHPVKIPLPKKRDGR